MKLTFLGAAHEVTGSCTLLETAGKKLLIDYGMEQGKDLYENCPLPVTPGELDGVLLTHAHMDHAGRLPLLAKQGYDGPIFTTEATAALCRIMLADSAHIQQADTEWKNRKAARSGGTLVEPLYTQRDVEKTCSQFAVFGYGKSFAVCPGVTAKLLDAGHLLGSASIELTVTENAVTKTVLFSGDIGNRNRPLIRDPQCPEKADVVVIESTYGDRLHGERPDYVRQLTRILQETLDRGGNVVIPAFAVGRTQEMLYLLRTIREQRLVKGHDSFPVWVDSPLAAEATGIYDTCPEGYYDAETLELLHSGVDPIRFPGLYLSKTAEESKALNTDPTPKVILASSGMCEAGRIRHHLKHNLWRPESTVLFVGYQSEGTLGRLLLNGAGQVKLFGEPVQVRAQIESMDGISGHADQGILLDWVSALPEKPEMIYVNHGEDAVCDTFAALLREKLGVPAIAPYNGAEYDLATGTCIREGNKVHLAGKRENAVYDRLMQAVKRLQRVAESFRGRTSKEMAQLADQIQNLCSRWEK